MEIESPALMPTRMPGGMFQPTGPAATDSSAGTLKPNGPNGVDFALIADMLSQYAAILESGVVDCAGHYLPEDIRRQARLIGGE